MSIKPIPISEIPYLSLDALGDRTLHLMPLWDGNGWHIWIPADGGVIHMRPRDALKTDYVAREPACETDLLIPFVEFMWQRASYPEICPKIRAICIDFHNLATCTAKLHHSFRTRENLPAGVTGEFVATEIEYLITCARGIFDFLQEVISHIWSSRVRFHDSEAERHRKAHSLPKTFSKMVLKDKRHLKNEDQIRKEYGLTSQLAKQYARHASFFSGLRDVRDKIIHDGADVPTIYVTDKGLCVNPKAAAFGLFENWKDEHYYNENIVSLMPWVSHVIFGTIGACTAIMAAFSAEIEFPREIAPGYRVFVRGVNNQALIDLVRIEQGLPFLWQSEELNRGEV